MLNLIPSPQKLEITEGFLSQKTLCVYSAITDTRIKKAIEKLPLSSDGIPLAIEIGSGEGEAYILTAQEDRISLKADSNKGAFYGIQTLRQILANESVPCFHIEDEPDYAYRGFLQDITRGQILTLDRFKQLVDEMAYYKLNSLQLNVEHTFAFREFADSIDKTGCMTQEEVRELDEYCYENFIELIPAMATFGHLYVLLQKEKYHHLREIENFEPKKIYWMERQVHHTIDPAHPESIELIKSLIDQCVPLFRSNRFNICCDETFDLQRGKHQGMDAGKLYVDFAKQIINYVQSKGKTVMMWSDVLLNHREVIDEVPENMEFLTWWYDENVQEDDIKEFSLLNKPQMICPGTSSWWGMSEIPRKAEINIGRMIETGHRYGAIGVLNTNWGDYGHTASMDLAMYGLILGAEKSWSVSTEIDDAFRSKVNALLYQNENAYHYLDILGELQRGVPQPDLQPDKECSLWKDLCALYSNTVSEEKREVKLLCEDVVSQYQQTALKLIDNLKQERWNNDIYPEEFLIAAEGTLAIVELYAKMAGYSLTQTLDVSAWLKRYRKQWLLKNKEGELREIETVFNGILSVIEK